jgi:hypothetical protein
MNTEYSKEMIEFAEDVADMMAKRKKVEEIKRAQRIAPIRRKYNNDDFESACYELRLAECEVKEWLDNIFGEEEQ